MQEEWTTKQKQQIAMQDEWTPTQEWISMQKDLSNNTRKFEQQPKKTWTLTHKKKHNARGPTQ
jgi:hypothetical protein